jgi:hypothetical protein
VHAAGAPTAVVNKAAFEGSGLTLCGQRDVDFHGIDSVWERLDAVCDLAERPGSLTYCYESDLDHTGHGKGCESPQWLEVLRKVDADVARLRDELPGRRRPAGDGGPRHGGRAPGRPGGGGRCARAARRRRAARG